MTKINTRFSTSRIVTGIGFAALAFFTQVANAEDFKISSRAQRPNSAIGADNYWNNFGCSGANVLPDLSWSNAPAGTKSFAVTFHDKDAPTGSGFWHWVAYDIPSQITSLPGGVNGGVLPEGTIEGNTDLGKPGFFGPCPPVGRKHEYSYTVHALKVEKLPVEKGATAAMVGFFLWQNSLGKASLIVTAGPRK
ncbi:YbhB/YbcL family Raf kinase inhibitor-like protein [Undibacterium curvum]|jgi:Raf kinase inhibitor-like YbhB/YbcL family protein|uniref:YbhB/YbcL family Raf kinase inhibitor-like protein n=1 Tax=Undibacterium curvum TaxID=2762294 RepID=UPI003D0CE36B